MVPGARLELACAESKAQPGYLQPTPDRGARRCCVFTLGGQESNLRGADSESAWDAANPPPIEDRDATTKRDMGSAEAASLRREERPFCWWRSIPPLHTTIELL